MKQPTPKRRKKKTEIIVPWKFLLGPTNVSMQFKGYLVHKISLILNNYAFLLGIIFCEIIISVNIINIFDIFS